MKPRNFKDIKTILFENVTIKQTILKNTFWLAIAGGADRLLTFFLFVYVARILGPLEYGKFAFAMSFIAFFSIFSDLGLVQIITRELSRQKETEKEYPSLLSLKFILVLGTIVAIFIGSFFITSDSIIRKIIWVLSGYVIIGGFAKIIYGFFQARQRMEYEAWARTLEAVIYTAFGFIVIFNFPSALNLAAGYLTAVLIFLLFLLFFFHYKIHSMRFGWDKSIWKRYLIMSWPLAISSLFATIYNETDVIMMGFLGQITQTGWYNAAFKIIGAVFIPAALVSTSFFPVLSKSFTESKEKFQRIWNHQMNLMLYLAVPIITGGIVLASKIIGFIYGQNYFPSVLTFQILIVMAGIMILYATFQQGLIVANQQKKIFWVSLAGALSNVVLNAILIPKYSLYGAAVATVVANFLILLLMVRFTLKQTTINPFNSKILTSFIVAVSGSLIMYFVISRPQIYNLNVLFTILIGAGIYFLCLLGYLKLTNNKLLIWNRK